MKQFQLTVVTALSFLSVACKPQTEKPADTSSLPSIARCYGWTQKKLDDAKNIAKNLLILNPDLRPNERAMNVWVQADPKKYNGALMERIVKQLNSWAASDAGKGINYRLVFAGGDYAANLGSFPKTEVRYYSSAHSSEANWIERRISQLGFSKNAEKINIATKSDCKGINFDDFTSMELWLK